MTFKILKGLGLVAGIAGIFAGCSSLPKESEHAGSIAQGDGPGYFVRERYPDQVPDWAANFESFKKANNGKGENYYLGESGDTNDRIAGCELAELSGKKRIAQEIAELVMSRIGSAKSGVLTIDKDSQTPTELGSDFQNLIASESVAFLSGVQELGSAWEERDYSPSSGKKHVYLCKVAVMIDDTHMREAIQKTGKRVGSALADPVAKGLVDSAFKKLDQGFGQSVKNDEE